MARKIRSSEIVRISGKLKKKINEIKAAYILQGKTPPTTSQITEKLAENMKAEEWYDFKFKF